MRTPQFAKVMIENGRGGRHLHETLSSVIVKGIIDEVEILSMTPGPTIDNPRNRADKCISSTPPKASRPMPRGWPTFLRNRSREHAVVGSGFATSSAARLQDQAGAQDLDEKAARERAPRVGWGPVVSSRCWMWTCALLHQGSVGGTNGA